MKKRGQMTAAEKARAAVLAVEIPAAELAVRIAEQAMGMKRPVGASAEEALREMDATAFGMSDGFLRAGAAALFYFRECINAGRQVH